MQPYMFEDEERETLFALTDNWLSLEEDLCDFQFDYANFKKIAVETFPYIAKFTGKDLPAEIVELILGIHAFAINRCVCGAECDAAKLVAERLCEVSGRSGITHVSCQEYVAYEDAALTVRGPTDIYTIDPTTFDLSKLIADIEENW